MIDYSVEAGILRGPKDLNWREPVATRFYRLEEISVAVLPVQGIRCG